jgi:DNA polymerase III subunit epsilon
VVSDEPAVALVTAWWDGRAIAFDTETDGIEPTEARIIQSATVLIEPGSPADADVWIYQPERAIPQEAIDVHGITTERAENEGVVREMGVTALAFKLATAGVPVICHNAPYDLTVLDREMRRLMIGSLGAQHGAVQVRIDGREVGQFHVIDTMTLDKGLDPFRKGPAEGGRNRLTTACGVYRVPMPDGAAHDAGADALGCARLAWAIARRCSLPSAELFELYRDRKRPQELVKAFYDLGALTLAQLHALQVRWYREQALHLIDYFAESGKGDPATVRTVWPFEPLTQSAATVADVL